MKTFRNSKCVTNWIKRSRTSCFSYQKIDNCVYRSTMTSERLRNLNLIQLQSLVEVDVMKVALWCFARYGTICTIYTVKNTHGEVSLFVKLASNFIKSNTSPWVFFKLYKWYQIALRITYIHEKRKQKDDAKFTSKWFFQPSVTEPTESSHWKYLTK